MYQEYFRLQTLPFNLTPNPSFFCQLKGHQEALNTLQFAIHSGEGFIKIIGEVGAGKTLLCRKLLENLGENDIYVTAYLPNPDLAPIELRKAFARELGLDPIVWNDQHELLTGIYRHLIKLHAEGKKVVLLVDEAQALSDEGIETIRLLTNLETEHAKLLQVVLFAQPELDTRLNQSNLRQLKQRITFSYRLPLMNRDDLDIYLNHRLAVAGFTHGSLFTRKARNLLYKASSGVPRIVNILSHKALLVAYGQGEKQIDHKAMRLAVHDTESVYKAKNQHTALMLFGTAASIAIVAMIVYLTGNISR